eukprot:1154988-Pelagomonas_calceolata.AAC.4
MLMLHLEQAILVIKTAQATGTRSPNYTVSTPTAILLDRLHQLLPATLATPAALFLQNHLSASFNIQNHLSAAFNIQNHLSAAFNIPAEPTTGQGATKLHNHAIKTWTRINNTKRTIQMSEPTNGGLGGEAAGRAAYRRVRHTLGRMANNPPDPH